MTDDRRIPPSRIFKRVDIQRRLFFELQPDALSRLSCGTIHNQQLAAQWINACVRLDGARYELQYARCWWEFISQPSRPFESRVWDKLSVLMPTEADRHFIGSVGQLGSMVLGATTEEIKHLLYPHGLPESVVWDENMAFVGRMFYTASVEWRVAMIEFVQISIQIAQYNHPNMSEDDLKNMVVIDKYDSGPPLRLGEVLRERIFDPSRSLVVNENTLEHHQGEFHSVFNLMNDGIFL